MTAASIISLWRFGLLFPLLLSAGCGSVSYLTQAVMGQGEILARRQPVEELLADERTPAMLRRQLQAVQEIRRFAIGKLGLPDNGSYTTYSDLGRPYAVWNVVAAPEFSVEPRRWCFPVAGCVFYRGYFSREAAERAAARLREEGDDVFVGGVTAYSTLGWFDDPVLSTFVGQPEAQLAALIFHELAHQVVYVKGDTTFNESFAAMVEEEGVRRWLLRREEWEALRRYAERAGARRRTQELLLSYRERLARLYGREGLAPAEMRRRKAEILAELRQVWRDLRAGGGGGPVLEGWFRSPNNALLATVSAYAGLVPAFRELLREEGDDLPRFYRRVGEIAALPPEARHRALD